MTHAFISYVKEDREFVEYIVDVLRQNDVEVWLDKDDIALGMRWKDSIRNAIRDGKFFVPIFSRNWENREKSYANEELTLAIDELRQRPTNRTWYVPLRIDECALPDRSIGGGENLQDIQYLDFPTHGYGRSLLKLLQVMGVEEPKVDIGEPLGAGLSSNVDITGGHMTVTGTQPPILHMNGLVFTVVGGWITRGKDSSLLAYISTQAPSAQLQELNIKLGTAAFSAVSNDGYVSNNPDKPNLFGFSNDIIISANTPVWNMQTSAYSRFPFDLSTHVEWTAKGHLDGQLFSGTAESSNLIEIGETEVRIQTFMTFQINVKNSLDGKPLLTSD